jgi:hypothetical protein
MSKKIFLEQNLKDGEIYAGLILGKDGAQDYHVFRKSGQIVDVDWDAYMAWVKSVGGEATTLRELSLMFANIPEEFDKGAYWSGEQYESNVAYAWYQYFLYGDQDNYRKTSKLRGVAVRRLIIR